MTSSLPVADPAFDRWAAFALRSKFVVHQLRPFVDQTVELIWCRRFQSLPLPVLKRNPTSRSQPFTVASIATQWEAALRSTATKRAKTATLHAVDRAAWDDASMLPWALARALVPKSNAQHCAAADCDETFIFNFLLNTVDAPQIDASHLKEALHNRNTWAHETSKHLTPTQLSRFTTNLREILCALPATTNTATADVLRQFEELVVRIVCLLNPGRLSDADRVRMQDATRDYIRHIFDPARGHDGSTW